MAAEFHQVLRATREGSVEIETADTAAGAFALVAVQGYQERGAPEALDYARRNDTYDAGMPSVSRQHQGKVGVEIHCLFNLFDDLPQDLLIHRLAAGVQGLQRPCLIAGR